MSLSISTSQSAASFVNVDPSKMASKVASKMMSDLDGSISKDEFVTGMTSKGMSSANAGKMYDSIDTKQNGSITKTDIESAVKSGALKPSSDGSRPPPSGGSGAGGASGVGATGGASGSSSSSKSYEAADTNKDGTVSEQESLIYSLKHPSSSTSETADSSKLGKNVDQLV